MVMRWFVLRQSALSHAMIDSTINAIVQEISAAAERCHCDRWHRCRAALAEMSHDPSAFKCDCDPFGSVGIDSLKPVWPPQPAAAALSAQRLQSRGPPHLRRDCARRRHICTGTGPCICIRGSPLPHLLQDRAHPRGAHRSEALSGRLRMAPGRARAERDQQRWPVKDKAFVVRLDTESFVKEVEFIRQSGPHARTCTLSRTHARTHTRTHAPIALPPHNAQGRRAVGGRQCPARRRRVCVRAFAPGLGFRA
jgi:hypothetical protein